LALAGILAIISSVSYAHTRFVSWELYREEVSRFRFKMDRLEDKLDTLIFKNSGAAPHPAAYKQAQYLPPPGPGGSAPISSLAYKGSLNGTYCSVFLLEPR
jgi:hypothetical protein